MTLQFHMDSLDGTYVKKFEAEVTATISRNSGIRIKLHFITLAVVSLQIQELFSYGKVAVEGLIDVRKKNRIRHMFEGDLPDVGMKVKGNLDWERRYSHMRMHTSQHLVSCSS